MHPIFKPAFYLMNHLSYRGKFILICSVFAIPLAIFATQLATSYHQQAEQAQITLDGLGYIQKSSLLMKELEKNRDLTVITSWSADSKFAAYLQENRLKALKILDQLISTSNSMNNDGFLYELRKIIKTDENTKGIESGSIDAVYEDAQSILDRVYNWRAKLSYKFISSSGNNKHTLAIINLLNEMDSYTYSLGKARTFGSFYLAQQFVDSYGAQALEKNYQELSQLIDLIDVKEAEYQEFFLEYPEANLSNFKQSLIDTRELLYKKLIFSSEATSDPHEYFESMNNNFEVIYDYNLELFELSTSIVAADYQKSLKQLWAFYLVTLCIALLLFYLGLGLYHSISVTIRELLKSAAFFAAGKYDKPVKIISHDELMAVAEAMDSMRINIMEREEKLSLISQTDGLTQLSNRKFFDQALQMSLANTRRNMTPLTIVMIDIDFFKRVNDEYGHLAGDACLIQIASMLKDQFKRQTDVVARYGGEEFIAILYGQDLEEAKIQTEQLRKRIESTEIVSNEHAFRVTASFGLVCLNTKEDASPEDIIALADTLLYRSKDGGRNMINAEYYAPNKA